MVQLRRLSRIVPLIAILGVAPAVALSVSDTPACAGNPADQAQIAQTMRTMYAAATADDLAKFHTVAAPISMPSTAVNGTTGTPS